jgi:phosphinothricin acetyltransferase
LVPPDVAELNTRRDSTLKGGYPCVVDVLDDNLVGYAYAGPRRFQPVYRYTVENTVYLHPDQQGRRIALPLLQHVTDEYTKRGYR